MAILTFKFRKIGIYKLNNINWLNYWNKKNIWTESDFWKKNNDIFFLKTSHILSFSKKNIVLDIGCGNGRDTFFFIKKERQAARTSCPKQKCIGHLILSSG